MKGHQSLLATKSYNQGHLTWVKPHWQCRTLKPDPDLEIRKGWGGGGEPSLPKKFCRPFGPQFGLKIRGEGRGPWAPPLNRHCLGPHFFPSNWLMLYSNGFSVELSSFEANIEKEGGKEVERNMSTLVIQLTQVLMSRIVAGL